MVITIIGNVFFVHIPEMLTQFVDPFDKISGYRVLSHCFITENSDLKLKKSSTSDVQELLLRMYLTQSFMHTPTGMTASPHMGGKCSCRHITLFAHA